MVNINNILKKLCPLATLLALIVIGLGAYTRLTDAGLGCPDWPGCYGQITVPNAETAKAAFPQAPLTPYKAFNEMFHRYIAGTLALMLFCIGILGFHQNKMLSLSLVALIIFQALLGMWTVTLKLHPGIVTLHLMGGLTTASLLWWWTLRLNTPPIPQILPRSYQKFAGIGLILLVLQILLGGLTSSHYAALACLEFPNCLKGEWLFSLQFVNPHLLSGPLNLTQKASLHMFHRFFAFTIALYLISMSWVFLKNTPPRAIKISVFALVAGLALQISLGISNVLFGLPLPIALLHNLTAAFLLLTLICLFHLLTPQTRPAYAH